MKYRNNSGRLDLSIIKPRDTGKRVVRSFRIKKTLDDKLGEIADNIGETKTYVVESLLDFAIKQWEKEGKDG